MNIIVEGINYSGKSCLINNIRKELEIYFQNEFLCLDYNTESNEVFDILNFNMKYHKLEEESMFMLSSIKYFEHYKTYLYNRKYTLSESGIISLFNYDVDIMSSFEYLAHTLKGYIPDLILYLDIDPNVILERLDLGNNDINFVDNMNKIRSKQKIAMDYIYKRTQNNIKILSLDANNTETTIASEALDLIKNIIY